MEWTVVLVPLIAIVFSKLRWPHQIVWWECLIGFLPTVIIIPVVSCTSQYTQTVDYERWGGWCTEVRYYEDWDEYVHRTCSRSVPSGRDSNGNTTYRTEYYDCSYVDYHPEYWELHESNGLSFRVSEDSYRAILNKFGGRATFKDLGRSYHTNDGDMYFCHWPGTDESFQTIFSEHTYENRVQASKGVYEFPDVDPEKYGLFEFPDLNNMFQDPAILGNHPQKAVADSVLQEFNARMGRQHEIRVWVLLFHDVPRTAGFEQESYWKGGNKNELVVCIGLDVNNEPTWCHPFCWSPDGYAGNDTLKINIRNYVELDASSDLVRIVDFIIDEIPQHWKRKDFDEFDYLSIKIPGWAIIVIWTLSILSTAGVIYFAVHNEHTERNTEHFDIKKWFNTRFNRR